MKPKKEELKKVRFQGVAPEGYKLIRNEVLEELKDFDNWKAWKNSEISLQDLDKLDICD